MAIVKPTPEMRKTILKEQGTSEERIKQDVQNLRQWLKKQPHLPQNTDDGLLECFAVGCKGVEDAKLRLDRFFTVRNYLPNYYADRDPKKLQKPDAVEQFLLPGYTRDGKIVFIMRIPEGADPNNFDHVTMNKRQTLIIDYLLYQGIICSGYIVLYDFAGLNKSMIKRLSLCYFSKSKNAFQENYPVQVKKLLLCNCSSFVVNTYHNLVKPFIKEKFTNRIHILNGIDEKKLKENIPDEILPKDFGGSGSTCQQLNDYYVKLLEKERDWCIASQDIKSDESKRSVKAKYEFQQEFGLEGNFRTLNVD